MKAKPLRTANAPNTIWHVPGVPSLSQHLHIGIRGSDLITDPPAGQHLGHNTKSYLVPTALFTMDMDVNLAERFYYRPKAGNQPTFDSFVYQEKGNLAIVFQITVGKTHAVKLEGFLWLQKLGVKKICYVAVTPPGTLPTLPFPNDLPGQLVPQKFLLEIKK